MPELPEVEALARFLSAQATGRRIERIELASLAALKTVQPPIEALRGQVVSGVERRGKHVCFHLGPEWLVVHLSRAGWVQWRDEAPVARAKMGKGPLALRVALSDGAGFDLTEAGTEKRLAIWVVADPGQVDGVARLGPDPLAEGFDRQALGAALASRPGNLKTVLTDQSVLAGVGNAYSDEILHAAHLSPFKAAGKLTPTELEELHAALVSTLGDAVERSRGLPAKGLKGEKKSGMAVHGRAGLPCPVCGDTVREVSFATKSMQYCPTCQTGGRALADRRLSRLLK